jgi:hypothetical protein
LQQICAIPIPVRFILTTRTDVHGPFHITVHTMACLIIYLYI